MSAWLHRRLPDGTSFRCRSSRSRGARDDRPEGGFHRSGAPREPHGPRQGIGRSLQIRDSVRYSSLRYLLRPKRLTSMVRPTRSLVVTGISISAVHHEMQSAEKQISFGLFCGQSLFCTLQGSGRVSNAWTIAKVASDRAKTSRILLDVDARLVGNLGRRAGAPESGVFRGIFAVQLHGKVRCYDARPWGQPARGRSVSRGGGPRWKTARCAAFWHVKCLERVGRCWPGKQSCGGLRAPTFRIIYREAQ
jgi:hypothetical protein